MLRNRANARKVGQSNLHHGSPSPQPFRASVMGNNQSESHGLPIATPSSRVSSHSPPRSRDPGLWSPVVFSHPSQSVTPIKKHSMPHLVHHSARVLSMILRRRFSASKLQAVRLWHEHMAVAQAQTTLRVKFILPSSPHILTFIQFST